MQPRILRVKYTCAFGLEEKEFFRILPLAIRGAEHEFIAVKSEIPCKNMYSRLSILCLAGEPPLTLHTALHKEDS